MNKLQLCCRIENEDIAVVKIVCGLGNPGSQYKLTWHNLGFAVIDRLVDKVDGGSPKSEAEFDYWTADAGDRRIYLVKPTTYMNQSGLAGKEALRIFGGTPEELFVISDDFNLPLGILRIRQGGSAGGHRGLQAVIDQIATMEFPRLRLGIGPLPEAARLDYDLITEFVLTKIGPEEEDIVEKMISRAVEATWTAVRKGLDVAINIYNSTNPAPEK